MNNPQMKSLPQPRRSPAASIGAALTALAATAVLLAGCATMPLSGPVHVGGEDVVTDDSVGIIAQGPQNDATPEEIVRGFMLAAQAGPTSVQPFAVAQEYLTASTGRTWRPYARVLLVDGGYTISVQPGVGEATVTASGQVIAALDERGAFAAKPAPASTTLTFRLISVGGQWRIDQLDDGLIIPAEVFTSAYHRTRLYFPTVDGQAWVPDVRWFPQQTWRTNAVAELLAGPPSWLVGVARTAAPSGARLAMESVTIGPDDTYQVILTEEVAAASGSDRAMLAAQIEATLNAGQGQARDVTLTIPEGPLPVPEAWVPPSIRAQGAAIALRDGGVWMVSGRELVPFDVNVTLTGLNPTALAVGYGDNPLLVVRDGEDQIVRLSDGEVLLSADGGAVIPPSVDRFGVVWSGTADGGVNVVLRSGGKYAVSAPWLDGRTLMGVRISPEGARAAVVSGGDDGVSIHVAGVVRGAGGVPTALGAPMAVGISLHGVTQAVWQDDTVLAAIADVGSSSDEGPSGAQAVEGNDLGVNRGVFLVGIGGLESPGGMPRHLAGVVDPTAVTASVGSANTLALDARGLLHLRQSVALWPVVGQHVDLVAYPG
ncbi:MAG: LpqB family beta-propeller domain-containing protein [Cellulomonadaceae bacterium]|jgi:hypothetical protein|nr:LpqB family beta-propeller domain-containing protein [Cellulomonadaceae bacterium]